jgi:hypothetical protein
VRCAAWSGDGRRAVTASRAIRLWDVASGGSRVLTEEQIEQVRLLPDARQALTSGPAGLALWNLWEGRLERQLDSPCQALAVHLQQPRGATARGAHIALWDLASGQRKASLEGHTDSVLGLTFMGDWLVSASADGTIRVWDQERCHRVLRGHAGGVRQVAGALVSLGDDGTVRVWQLDWELESRPSSAWMPSQGRPVPVPTPPAPERPELPAPAPVAMASVPDSRHEPLLRVAERLLSRLEPGLRERVGTLVNELRRALVGRQDERAGQLADQLTELVCDLQEDL